MVKRMQENSGWTWSDEHGANIGPAEEGTWKAFIASLKKPRRYYRFKHAGWVLWADADIILGASQPKGTHVYRASQVPEATFADNRKPLRFHHRFVMSYTLHC